MKWEMLGIEWWKNKGLDGNRWSGIVKIVKFWIVL